MKEILQTLSFITIVVICLFALAATPYMWRAFITYLGFTQSKVIVTISEEDKLFLRTLVQDMKK